MNTYYKILNEIASVFDMDQWDDQVNLFTDAIEKQLDCFIYNVYESTRSPIDTEDSFHLCYSGWTELPLYQNKFFVNGEKTVLSDYGYIKNIYQNLEYIKVTIEDIKLLLDCKWMFKDCWGLISVPMFDTSNVYTMSYMFYRCYSLQHVPALPINNLKIAPHSMFAGCTCLTEETKQIWWLRWKNSWPRDLALHPNKIKAE